MCIDNRGGVYYLWHVVDVTDGCIVVSGSSCVMFCYNVSHMYAVLQCVLWRKCCCIFQSSVSLLYCPNSHGFNITAKHCSRINPWKWFFSGLNIIYLCFSGWTDGCWWFWITNVLHCATLWFMLCRITSEPFDQDVISSSLTIRRPWLKVR